MQEYRPVSETCAPLTSNTRPSLVIECLCENKSPPKTSLTQQAMRPLNQVIIMTWTNNLLNKLLQKKSTFYQDLQF